MTTNTKIPNDFSKKSPFKELFVPGTGVEPVQSQWLPRFYRGVSTNHHQSTPLNTFYFSFSLTWILPSLPLFPIQSLLMLLFHRDNNFLWLSPNPYYVFQTIASVDFLNNLCSTYRISANEVCKHKTFDANFWIPSTKNGQFSFST